MLESTKLTVERVPIDRLHLNPANPRVNDPGVPHVAASLKRFGWQQPIVARRCGEVIAGNTRLKAAQSLGMTEVPVVWFEGTDLEATAFGIADNRTAEYSAWDDRALASILQELKAEDALDGVGFSDQDIDDLIASLDDEDDVPSDLDDPGPVDPTETSVTRPGDLWILGDHRLLCGDSTNAEDLDRLMVGDKAALFATDPPYCVNYTGNDRPIHDGKPSGKDWSHVYHEVDIADLGEFLNSAFTACLPHVVDDAPVYVWHAHVQQPVIAASFDRHGLLLHQVVVWVKPCATFGHSYFRWRHEPCAFGWKKGNKPTHGLGKLDTVWEEDWEGKARITTFHPTSKPVRLFEIPMEQHTRRGDVVLEPFIGSGSQLIAAERLGRHCRGMELEPAFVDGAVKRWEQASGKSAILQASGETFAAVAAERGVEGEKIDG